MTVRELLFNTLEGLGYEIGLQGSYEVDDIPDSLITYTIAKTEDIRHYNNKPVKTAYYLDVNFYSREFSKVDTVSAQISELLLAAGFTRQGDGYDASYDKETGHYGHINEFYYVLERKEK